MVQTNKILTVSYGTFSCTLEGFDESFETMKAIAEYFRDLAADDRYFGAEPPTPDAEMLARIAEREIARRVEAHAGDDGIVLRPSLADASAVPVHPAQADAGAQPSEEPAQSAPEETVDSVAARVAALNAAQEAEAADLETAVPDDAPEITDQHQDMPEDVSSDVLDEAAAFLTDEAQSEPDELTLADDAQGDSAEQARDDTEDDDEIAGDLAAALMAPRDSTAEDEESSLAAKLQRIRDVVSTPDADEDDYSEDEHADIDAETAEADEVVDSLMASLGEDEATELAEQTLDGLEDGLTKAMEDPKDAVAEMASDLVEDVQDAVVPDTTHEEASEAVEAPSDPVAEDEPSPIPAGASPRVAPRRPVRVVKVKRRSIEKAVAAGELEEDRQEDNESENEPVASAQIAPQDSTLSVEDEADLQRELSELEAELTGAEAEPATQEDLDPFEDDSVAAPDGTMRAVRAMANRGQLESLAEDDSDMSRLMAQTDEELQEPEGRNRRNAIAHLRAAVAATRADRNEGGQSAPADKRSAYREDLAQAVRPRRTVSERDTAETPRVAPLKLVAEQRVDVDGDDRAEAQRAAAQAVRPRRVSLRDTDEPDEQDGGGFAAFAEERGATRLPDLLEAAAAYMSFVEGREKFSRPQLMNKVRQIEELDSSREDRLRSFGQLLREGKIERVEGGRFVASDSIGFRPARAAG